ncbi:MAG: fibronectin type III domain-containing protein [Anaerolineae bacterium]|nr:fibronectin type III domain-containing protein [Gemmatimonadaceae bacterium]
MRTSLVLLVAALALTACTRYGDDITDPGSDTGVEAPSDLRYELIPSGDAGTPDGILLRWTDPGDVRIESFVVYSRGSTSGNWSRRAQTTSSSFHDGGIPHLQYYVAALDDFGNESRPSNTITVDERNQLPAPTQIVSVSLDRAIQLSWPTNSRDAAPSLFGYYRVYSAPYDLDQDLCDDANWVLEGSTVSEDFLATGFANGAPRCFTVSAISTDGHESVWARPRSDTPRYDARNIVVYARESALPKSGFRFFDAASVAFGSVVAGDRSDIDFRVERRPDGSLWFNPIRAGVRIALYGNTTVDDLTAVDLAPVSGYAATSIEALPGFAYVFETLLGDGLHYGAVRVTHVSRDYVILDWSYQSDRGNPELKRQVISTGGF